MQVFLRHVAIPALAPAAIVALYFTPVMVFGCVNRGLLAFGVVLISSGAAFVTIGLGMRESLRRRSATWWLLSTLILVLPLVLILGPLG
ncbi:MAG TPA: hypothetical protein VEC56_08320 [Candidatus Krumholzibacteria bacterium]|nr:hypothetical protein [Candidatus Krumholzibacteria bacterium]